MRLPTHGMVYPQIMTFYTPFEQTDYNACIMTDVMFVNVKA